MLPERHQSLTLSRSSAMSLLMWTMSKAETDESTCTETPSNCFQFFKSTGKKIAI